MYNVEKAESEAITIRIYNFTPDTAIAGKRVIALGIFDGVHLGHRKIIERAIYEARKLSVSAAVFTFIKESRILSDSPFLAKIPIALPTIMATVFTIVPIPIILSS